MSNISSDSETKDFRNMSTNWSGGILGYILNKCHILFLCIFIHFWAIQALLLFICWVSFFIFKPYVFDVVLFSFKPLPTGGTRSRRKMSTLPKKKTPCLIAPWTEFRSRWSSGRSTASPIDRKFLDFIEDKDLISSENCIYYLETSS